MITSGFKIPDTDYEIWKNNLLQRILIGGARTAIMIQGIVDHRPKDMGKLKEGTAVADVVDPTDSDVWTDVIPDHNLKPKKIGRTYMMCVFRTERIPRVFLFWSFACPTVVAQIFLVSLDLLQCRVSFSQQK